jgi:phosphinothricin acetyltransferase
MSARLSYHIEPINARAERYASDILKLFNHHIQHTFAFYDQTPRDLDHINAWFDAKNEKGYPILACLSDEKELMGFASYDLFRPQQSFSCTVEHSLYVQEQYAGLGLGMSLLSALMGIATSQGLQNMMAVIDHENDASIKLHQKMGFVQVGYLTNIASKFETWRDVVLLQFKLTSVKN